jgi:hypothetical protein
MEARMPRSQSLALALSALRAVGFVGCSTDSSPSANTGSLNLNLELAEDVKINEVDWTISGGDMEPMSGTIDTSAPGATASVEVFGIPPGEGYLVELQATDESGEVTCGGDAEFDVQVGVSTDVMVFLNCKRPTRLGGVRVNGKFNICAELAKVVVSPLQTSVGNDIDLSVATMDVEGDEVAIAWSATGGSIADPSAAQTTYTCAEIGDHSITVNVSDDGFERCMHDWTVPVTCVEGDGGTGGTGGAGGAGGEGGTGGAPTGTATVTAAHFAPEVPSAEDTAVAIYVNGEEVTALGTIQYGQTTGRVELPAPGTYDIGIGLAGGDGPLLELSGVELNDGDDIAAAAYRTNEELPVALFAYNLSTDGLEAGSGRVFVSHGANDAALDPVDIIVTDEGACPPPLLDDLAFGETRAEGGIDLAATTYNLGFDLSPGDCAAEVPFGAPVTEGVTTVLVAVDEDTGEGLAPQVWALVDAETVVALISPDLCEGVVCEDTECSDGACDPETGLCVDTPINEGGDCESGTGTCTGGVCVDNCAGVVCEEIECNVNACNPFTGECETEPVADGTECDGGAGVCQAGVCEPVAAACLYEQDFESLTPGDPPQAQPTSLAQDGWLVGANVFGPDGTTFLYNYFAFPAPNGGPAFSAVAVGEGGSDQGAQQLSIYNDYNNADHAAGNIIEAIVFRERTIEASDVGTTIVFTFDAKKGNIVAPTTAAAFIKTIAGSNTTNALFVETTNLPDTWGTFTISLPIVPELVGQVLQIGFQSRATNFQSSGIFYDNITLGAEGCGGDNGGGGGGELTTNGDFETGDTSGWTSFAAENNGTFAATMAQANGGAWSGNLVASVPAGGGPASFPVVKQANIGIGTVAPNSPVTISFDLFGSLTGAGGVVFAEFFSELSGGGTSKAEILSGGPLFPVAPNDWTAGWVTYTFNTTTGPDVSGGVTLQLKTDCGANAGCTVDAYFDNVSVTAP